MQKQFDLLAETIREFCGDGPVYYLANPGNWGDAIIRHGTHMFLKQNKISYHEIQVSKSLEIMSKQKVQGGTLLYGGGGAWSRLWHHGFTIIDAIKNHFDRIIVLPSSYETRYFLPNTTFFRRDQFGSKEVMPDALFCHDMAFCIGRLTSAHKGTGTGYFFRIEKESSGKIDIPATNQDISLKGNHFSPVAPFFEYILRYERIHTDRLHVAIGSCLLGKELHFYSGAYFKNRDVYLSSMAQNFPNAQFHDL